MIQTICASFKRIVWTLSYKREKVNERTAARELRHDIRSSGLRPVELKIT